MHYPFPRRLGNSGNFSPLAPHWPPFLRGERALAEIEHAAADGAEPGLRLELDGVAKRRVVHARQPDPDRPLAFGLGLRRRLIEELAGDSLGVDLADQRIALRALNARGRGGAAARF